jgi:hypothetical protein
MKLKLRGRLVLCEVVHWWKDVVSALESYDQGPVKTIVAQCMAQQVDLQGWHYLADGFHYFADKHYSADARNISNTLVQLRLSS